jgi:hypothetical protein
MEMRLLCSLIRFNIEIIFLLFHLLRQHSIEMRICCQREKDKLMFFPESVIEFQKAERNNRTCKFESKYLAYVYRDECKQNENALMRS